MPKRELQRSLEVHSEIAVIANSAGIRLSSDSHRPRLG